MKIKGLYNMPGSRYYWYRWSARGKRHAVSLKTDDISEAIKAVRKIQVGEAFARWERAEPIETPATKLVEDYLAAAQKRPKKPMRPGTANKQGAVLRKFLRDCQIENARDITLPVIQAWLEKLNGGSADTKHTYARVLHTFLLSLAKNGSIHREVANFDIPERAASGRKNWLKLETANDVISKAEDPGLRFVLFCGFHAGLRRNEIVNAKVKWFDLEAGFVHVQNDPKSGFVLKDRENRSIPISKPFRKFLCEYLAKRSPGEYALRPPKRQGTWVYRYDFSRGWKTYMKRCGVTCTINDARRSFASNLVSAGESIFIVAKWLGDGVQVVERSYGHLAPSAGNINRLTAKVA